jgi:hypothetical protein
MPARGTFCRARRTASGRGRCPGRSGQRLARDRAGSAARVNQDVAARLAGHADQQGGHGWRRRAGALGEPEPDRPAERVGQPQAGDQVAGPVLADPELELGAVGDPPPGLVPGDGLVECFS